MKSRNPNYLQYVKEKIALNQFMHHCGVEMTVIGEGEMQAELDFEKHHEQQNGYVHGGLTSMLCDIVAGFASYSLVEQGQKVFTVEGKVNYYRPGIGQRIIAKGWVVKSGKRFHFCESEVYMINNGEKTLIAKGNTTMGIVTD